MVPKTKPIHKPTVPPMAAPIFILSNVEGSILVVEEEQSRPGA
jgi:hypothetical protein